MDRDRNRKTEPQRHAEQARAAQGDRENRKTGDNQAHIRQVSDERLIRKTGQPVQRIAGVYNGGGVRVVLHLPAE